jgi:FkbM family methyltransferase
MSDFTANQITDKNNINSDLEKMFSTDLSQLKIFETSYFDDKIPNLNKNFILFGAGGLGRKILRGLKTFGIEPIAFSDNNEASWDTFIDGIPVYSPNNIVNKFGNNIPVIVSIWGANNSTNFLRIEEQLKALGCNKIFSFVPLFWKYSEIFLPYYSLEKPSQIFLQKNRIFQCLNLWGDIKSSEEYVSHLKWRMSLDYKALPIPDTKNHYFPTELFALNENEVFVDCGAFDGDTLQDFYIRQGGHFKKFFAIEPDPINFDLLQKRINTYPQDVREKIKPLSAIVNSEKKTVIISATGLQSSSINNEDQEGFEIESIVLDELLKDEKVSFIKMDIEGGERAALNGAINTIREQNPILAISVYHKSSDLWELPLFLESLSDKYIFYLRSHRNESWDVVCYAVPKKRILAQSL